jgi:hypothetical protein
MTLDLKQKYLPDRELYKRREDFAKATLALLGVEVIPVGAGTQTSEEIDGFHKNEEDRFDFKCEDLGISFEVTGTGWRRSESAERFDPNWREEGRRKASAKRAVQPVLKCKVDDAYALDIQDQLYFVTVNDGDGSWRFMPCNITRAFPIGFFASGERLFHMIPWDKWRTPAWMREHLAKLRKEVGK